MYTYQYIWILLNNAVYKKANLARAHFISRHCDKKKLIFHAMQMLMWNLV